MFVLTYSWTGSLLHKIFPHISLARLLPYWRDQSWLTVSFGKKKKKSFLSSHNCLPVCGEHVCRLDDIPGFAAWILYKYLCLVCHFLLFLSSLFFPSLFPSTFLGLVFGAHLEKDVKGHSSFNRQAWLYRGAWPRGSLALRIVSELTADIPIHNSICAKWCCWRRIVSLLPLSWQRRGPVGLKRLSTIVCVYACVTLPWAIITHVGVAAE